MNSWTFGHCQTFSHHLINTTCVGTSISPGSLLRCRLNLFRSSCCNGMANGNTHALIYHCLSQLTCTGRTVETSTSCSASSDCVITYSDCSASSVYRNDAIPIGSGYGQGLLDSPLAWFSGSNSIGHWWHSPLWCSASAHRGARQQCYKLVEWRCSGGRNDQHLGCGDRR